MSDADKANYGYFGTTLFQEINDFKTFFQMKVLFIGFCQISWWGMGNSVAFTVHSIKHSYDQSKFEKSFNANKSICIKNIQAYQIKHLFHYP